MFTKNEHADILNTMVDDQFDQVLDALRHSTAMDVRWEPVPVPNSETGDGSLVLRHNAICHHFRVKWKTTLGSATALTLAYAK